MAYKFNEYVSDGNLTTITCKKRNGELHYVLIDTEDLNIFSRFHNSKKLATFRIEKE